MKKPLPSSSIYLRIILFLLFSITTTKIFAQPDFGKSYVNITKNLIGGTVETGDTIQIRGTFVVRAVSTYDSCGFFDAVPAGTAYIPSSLAVLTNEGKIYKSFTDAFGDDCGYITGSNIRINLGFNPIAGPATAYRRGRIRNTDRPTVFSNCIMIASYKVKVTNALGTSINLGGGSVSYKPTALPISTITFAANNVAIAQNMGFCANSVGANAVSAEFNGTFGSGQPRNRGTSASVPPPYVFQNFTTNSPQDYFYGVANNTSIRTGYTTTNAWPIPDPAHRVHTVWDIIGDHTGAINPLLGNPPADTVANPNAGYMLVINAAYKTDTAFSYTVTGLVPNTYYELSAWMRNVCSRCATDSLSRQPSTPGYIPTAPGDSSGVYPNLTFGINGTDYYSTGYIKYTGQWVKKGFNYLTGPAQTSFTMAIRNNAPGGGGNDWAIDDIAIATCSPDLTMTPTGNTVACQGNQIDLAATVRSVFSNYIHWRWERSIDGGATWVNTGVSGTGSPVIIGGQYEYTANYPSFLADSSQVMHQYRIRVASTLVNLSDPNASFTNAVAVVVDVENCVPLTTDITSFDGFAKDNYSNLQWITTNESANVTFEIQRSTDRLTYIKVGTVNGKAVPGAGSTYYFIDPQPIFGQTYYRIKAVKADLSKFSKVVLLSTAGLNFQIKSLINPFDNKLSFELFSPIAGVASISLVDNYGITIKNYLSNISKGLQNVTLDNLDNVKSGVYFLNVQFGDKLINRKVIKLAK